MDNNARDPKQHNDYYLYAHKENDDIVYIGFGRLGRAWDARDRKKNKPHQDWMVSKIPFLDVEILDWDLSYDMADALETTLIQEHIPKFNVHKSPNYRGNNHHSSNLKGSKHGRSILDEDDIHFIKYTLVPQGVLQKNIAELFDLHTSTVSQIIREKTWRHV